MNRQTKKQLIILALALILLLALKWINAEKDSSNVAISYGEGETQVVETVANDDEGETQAMGNAGYDDATETPDEDFSDPEYEDAEYVEVSADDIVIAEVDEKDEIDTVEENQETETAAGTDTKAKTSNKKEKKSDNAKEEKVEIIYKFRNKGLWEEHFEKHGAEFSYKNKEEYLEGANIMLQNPDCLHKKEKEDNDDVYFLEATGEFAVVSTDGYLRTYFKPSKGKKYFDKQ